MLDKFKEECGVVGVWNHAEAANLAYLGLCALQHRGQEGVGVATLDLHQTNSTFHLHKGFGLVHDVFDRFDFSKLPGSNAIGHNRYTTAGDGRLANIQPLYSEISHGRVSLAHNGNLVNVTQLRQQLSQQGAIFNSSSDTEVILHLLARQPRRSSPVEILVGALNQVEGAYSLVVLYNDRLFAVRDPYGFRPLALAKIDTGYVVASETCAFDLIGAKYLRDLQPGEVLEFVGNNQPKSYFPFTKVAERSCIFEYIYFARPDSNVFGHNVYSIRKQLGIELAKEHPVKADFVIPVPDSGATAAIGYAQESGIPFELGLIRNHYIGRTFIEPQQEIRDFGVKIKLNANRALLQDKSVVVVDDSIVRGTTSKKLVKMLREAGAKEVHMRISSPPTTDPCFYGIDTPIKSELIAACKSVEEIGDYIGTDSLAYLSREGLYRAVAATGRPFCDACFSGKYPIRQEVEETVRKVVALGERSF